MNANTHVKRFTARTSRDALTMVRHAFGEDAVVLSTRPCAEGVEVLAMAPEGMKQLDKISAAAPHGACSADKASAPTPPTPAAPRARACRRSCRGAPKDLRETLAPAAAPQSPQQRSHCHLLRAASAASSRSSTCPPQSRPAWPPCPRPRPMPTRRWERWKRTLKRCP